MERPSAHRPHDRQQARNLDAHLARVAFGDKTSTAAALRCHRRTPPRKTYDTAGPSRFLMGLSNPPVVPSLKLRSCRGEAAVGIRWPACNSNRSSIAAMRRSPLRAPAGASHNVRRAVELVCVIPAHVSFSHLASTASKTLSSARASHLQPQLGHKPSARPLDPHLAPALGP